MASRWVLGRALTSQNAGYGHKSQCLLFGKWLYIMLCLRYSVTSFFCSLFRCLFRTSFSLRLEFLAASSPLRSSLPRRFTGRRLSFFVSGFFKFSHQWEFYILVTSMSLTAPLPIRQICPIVWTFSRSGREAVERCRLGLIEAV